MASVIKQTCTAELFSFKSNTDKTIIENIEIASDDVLTRLTERIHVFLHNNTNKNNNVWNSKI